MFGFDEAQQNYNDCQDPNRAEFSHELLAGGASFFAMHEFEKHQRNDGTEVSHGFAKEMIAGFAGAEVDRLAETKGADYIDREKAKRMAQDNAHQLYDQQYGQDENFHPERRGPHRRMQESFGDQYAGDQGRW